MQTELIVHFLILIPLEHMQRGYNKLILVFFFLGKTSIFISAIITSLLKELVRRLIVLTGNKRKLLEAAISLL